MDRGPSSPHYINQLSKQLLEPIKRGESVFARWFPGHGKTVLINTIFSDKELLKRHLGLFYQRFLFVKIEGYLFSALDLPSFFVYIQTALSELLEENKVIQESKLPITPALYPLILTVKKIINLCQKAVEKGLEVVFIIDGIDEFSLEKLKDVFVGWEYIVESKRERIHTHFNVNKREIIYSSVTQSSLIQNIIHISLPDKQECQYFISYYQDKWNLHLSKQTLDIIFKICGHDLVLLKEAVRIHKKNEHSPIDFISEPTLLLKAKIDFQFLSAEEKAIIEHKLKTNNLLPHQKKIAKELTEANFWDKDLQIPLAFEQVIIEGKQLKELILDKKDQVLKFGDIDLSKKLSETEYKILLNLFKKKGKLVTRDEIAEIIWGEKMLDLYSDWAIDKTVSRIRSKLASFRFYYQIKTKKKEGFYLEI